jgi:ABC-2 type transport system ATP-binding protein
VEVEDGSDALAAGLAAAGLSTIVDGRAVLIALDGDRAYDLVRNTVADLGLPLIRIEQRRHRLEDLFRDAPDGGAALVAPSPAPPPPPPPPAPEATPGPTA